MLKLHSSSFALFQAKAKNNFELTHELISVYLFFFLLAHFSPVFATLHFLALAGILVRFTSMLNIYARAAEKGLNQITKKHNSLISLFISINISTIILSLSTSLHQSLVILFNIL